MTRVMCVIVAALLLAPSAARADHSADEHITDNAAYTLRPNEWRVGLFKIQYGVPGPTWLRKLEVGTFLLPYALWAFDVKTANAHAKYRFFEHGRLSLSAWGGIFYVNADEALDSPATFLGFPFQLDGSFRVNDSFTLGAGFGGSYLRQTGAYDEEEVGSLQGAAAAQSGQFMASIEWRLGSTVAFVLRGRALGMLTVTAAGEGETKVDEYTTVEGFAAGEEEIGDGMGGSIALSAHFSWSHLNILLGMGYGNIVLPGLYLVTPKRTILPMLDIYYRF